MRSRRRSACRRGSSRPRACWPKPTRLTGARRRRFAPPAAGAWPRARRWPRPALTAARRAAAPVARAPPAPSPAHRRRSTPAALGRPRGRLAIIGIGPGDAAWRTPEASALLAAADDVVGYSLYLDLLGRRDRRQAPPRQRDRRGGRAGARWRSILPPTAARWRWSRRAMPASTAWRRWSSSCSTAEARRDWSAVEIAVAPGISAMQAAAARLGAPLGHDFCAISLSDLMTPWAAIRSRHRSGGGRRFRRRARTTRARRAGPAISPRRPRCLLAHRRPDTPVAIARNLGRDGETCQIVARSTSWPSADSRHAEPGAGRQFSRPAALAGATAARSTRRAAISASRERVTVHFIGAGPGAPDLITVRGLRLIERCPVCLYAGSLVPRGDRRGGAARRAGRRHRAADPGRDHRRDRGGAHAPASTSRGCTRATRRSMARSPSRCAGSMALGIPYDVTPGVPAFAAAAAALAPRADPARCGADRDPDPHRGARLGDARRAKASTASPPAAPRWRSICRSPTSRGSCARWCRITATIARRSSPTGSAGRTSC